MNWCSYEENGEKDGKLPPLIMRTHAVVLECLYEGKSDLVDDDGQPSPFFSSEEEAALFGQKPLGSPTHPHMKQKI